MEPRRGSSSYSSSAPVAGSSVSESSPSSRVSNRMDTVKVQIHQQDSDSRLQSMWRMWLQSQGLTYMKTLVDSRRRGLTSQRQLVFTLMVLVIFFFTCKVKTGVGPEVSLTESNWWHERSGGSTDPPTTPPPYVSPGPYLVEYPSEYHFTINQPRKCEEEKPFLVLMVPVAPKNRVHRDVVRSTWGAESLVLDKVVKLFFLLGLYTGEGDKELQEQLQQESGEHRDLIQSNFVDCYKNLTIKTMVMLEWLDTYCSNAAYAMKIDSDMFLNVPNLIKMLADAPKTDYLSGRVEKGRVLRNKTSKWYIPEDLYPQSHFPRYALGLGYVLSLDLSKKLVEAAKHVKSIYIEDAHLGMCMEQLGVDPRDPPYEYFFHIDPLAYNRCEFSKIIATTTAKDADMMKMWSDFKKPGPHC